MEKKKKLVVTEKKLKFEKQKKLDSNFNSRIFWIQCHMKATDNGKE